MASFNETTALPKNEEAERSVLGAVLLDEQHLSALLVDEQLQPEHFYVKAHGLIFQAILDLYEASSKIDHLTVGDRLRQKNELDQAGGQEAIELLTSWVPTIGHARDYGRIVREQAQMRGLIEAADEIKADVLSRSGSPRDLMERAERAMLEVAHDERQRAVRSIEDVLHEELDRLQIRSTEKTSLTGTPSGFKRLDELTGGFQPGNLIILAARPSMGKSALVANFAENAALAGKPVALFSLEMSETELAQRFVASQARVKGEDLRLGKIGDREWPKISEAAARLASSPLYIDDSSDTSVLDLRAKARRLHHQLDEQGGLGLIIVDYLQLMRPDGRIESRVEQVGQISRGLKSLARELRVPVVALSQLSRNVEQRAGDKKPVLSDLRECVTGDTLVLLADGTRVPIAELAGTEPEVLALDERHRVIRARSDAVWAVGRREVIRVSFASGRQIRATAKHRLLAGQGWTRVGELCVGDRVALARSVPEPQGAQPWPNARVALLGQLIGDGSYLSGQPMRYTTASEENSRAVTNAARNEFGATVKRYAGRDSWHQLLISGNGNRWHPTGVGAWLKQLGIFGQRSHEKRIPREAFKLPDEQIALLLRHLWATDGSIWCGCTPAGRPSRRIYYATSSRGLADDVAALLLRLGIVARIGKTVSHDRTMWSVVVSGGQEQRRFLNSVGAYGPRVPQALKLAASMPAEIGTNTDTLPMQVWGQVKEVMAAGGVSTRAVAARRGTAYGGSAHFKFAPSRDTVASYAEALDSAQLRDLAETDVFWDRVVSIVPAGQEEVYDLTVPGPASWLADGLVSHNSGAIEQDADLVMFIYREDYYTKEESTRPGEADVIIAKHRNGAIGDVVLTFQKDYPRFVNYVPPQFE